jgi:hypothetical protein
MRSTRLLSEVNQGQDAARPFCFAEVGASRPAFQSACFCVVFHSSRVFGSLSIYLALPES